MAHQSGTIDLRAALRKTETYECFVDPIPEETFIQDDASRPYGPIMVRGCMSSVTVSPRVIKDLTDEEHEAFFEQLTGLSARKDL